MLEVTAEQKEASRLTKDEWREIVGVVGNTHDDGMDKESPSSVYWPILIARFEGNDVDVRRYVAFSIRGPRAGSESRTWPARSYCRTIRAFRCSRSWSAPGRSATKPNRDP